tara:strand:+ start:3517 stop:4821 length:1305 start_codon:yes stop_codon:yes gene_type:complete
MQQTVRLLGELGERYGADHEYYNLRTPAEAIKLLCINHPKLVKELAHAHEHGVGYRVIQAGTDLDYPDLQLPLGKNDLIVTPVITGSGGDSTGRILLGVGLVALSFVTIGSATALGGLFAGIGNAGAFGSAAIGSIGASLILGGVSDLLSPQPTIPGLSGLQGPITNENLGGPQSVQRATSGVQTYAYSGPANTIGQGATIPVAYGEVLAGGHLISSDVDITSGDRNQITTFVRRPGQSSVLIGGERPIRSRVPTSKKNANKTIIQGSLIFKPTIGPKEGKYRSKQVEVNSFIYLRNGKRYSNFDDDQFGSTASSDLKDDWVGVMLQLNKGLFEHVSGPGTTKVDGFITYRLEVLRDMEKGPNVIVGSSTATIQGILRDKDNYRWCHLVKSAAIKNAERHFVRVYIVDFEVDKSLRADNLKVVGVGHRIGINIT